MGLNMRFVLLFGALFVCVILTGCNQVTAPQELTGDNEQTNQLADPIIQTDQTDVIDGAEDLINQFFGDWKSKGHNVIFEFRDGNGFFGYIESEIYSRIEFLISEVNLEEQSIVITGYDTRYDDEYEPFTEQ